MEYEKILPKLRFAKVSERKCTHVNSLTYRLLVMPFLDDKTKPDIAFQRFIGFCLWLHLAYVHACFSWTKNSHDTINLNVSLCSVKYREFKTRECETLRVFPANTILLQKKKKNLRCPKSVETRLRKRAIWRYAKFFNLCCKQSR